MKTPNIPNWALAGAALAVGGAALYLYFRGSRKIASDAVGVAGNVVAGTIEGMGNAFQDVTQATFGVPKTDATQCQKDLAAGDTWSASFSCPAGTWLRSLFTTDTDSKPKTATNVQTAPGGGLWSPSTPTFSSIFTSPNDGTTWQTFEYLSSPDYVLPAGVRAGELDWWGANFAPSNPVPVNSYGATALLPVAGFRG